jgi:hypothetical protein
VRGTGWPMPNFCNDQSTDVSFIYDSDDVGRISRRWAA